MKCQICGTPYKFYYPDFREIEQQCTCDQKRKCPSEAKDRPEDPGKKRAQDGSR
jgi:hypothetical protein